MSRKPADKLRPDQTRQAIWDWIRKNKAENGPQAAFAVKDIDVRLDKSSIRDYLSGLTAAGYLYAVRGAGSNAPTLYTLARDNGQEAPRVRKDGTLVTQGMAREKMWIAMGINSQKGRTFTVRDLTIGSTPEIPVSEVDARHYCHCLQQAGYLIEVKPGAAGQPAIYRMPPVKWTGPKPVQVQRTRRCYDPNTGAAVHVAVISVEGGE